MKKWLLAGVCIALMTGCTRYHPAADLSEIAKPEVKSRPEVEREAETESETETETEVQTQAQVEEQVLQDQERVKVKGIYVSAYAAGTASLMDQIIQKVDETEINAVVIDVKDDEGRVTFAMDTPIVNEISASKRYIGDIQGLIKQLKDRDIYVIARVVAFRDPFLAENKPEWSLKTADGSIYRDKKGMAWINPYCREVWDYLVEIGTAATEVGFDEIQFDYIRFATDSTMKQVVFDEVITGGKTKAQVITEFTDYMYQKLSPLGISVSADVFGAIIGSEADERAVGQDYADMTKNLDYICPMIYPSHYGDGNFGLEHPDMYPYETIMAALAGSRLELKKASDGGHQATVRPWLQDFTASYLKHHIPYGPEQLRAQIQAVYDSGYEEWILWNAACRYTWDGLLTKEEGVLEAAERERRRNDRLNKEEKNLVPQLTRTGE